MTRSGLTALKGLGQDLLDFIFPSHCYLCSQYLSSPEKFYCNNCIQNLPALAKPFCPICKIYITELPAIHFCQTNLEWVYSLWSYHKPVEILVHKIKYEGKTGLARNLGQILAEQIRANNSLNRVDLIVPVPLHHSRHRERGYNQAEIIAQTISPTLNLKMAPDLLIRKKNTKDQTRLTAVERIENVRDAFSVKDEIEIEGMTIMLVDDVITTGATLDECARTLQSAGARKIYACTLAVAV